MSNKVSEKFELTNKNEEKILCNHCMRTLSNGIRCMGICVADNDYWIKIRKLTQMSDDYFFQSILVLYLIWYLFDKFIWINNF